MIMDEERVRFYELSLAAMQIAVERKSVGFIDREGSNPSTPIRIKTSFDFESLLFTEMQVRNIRTH